jgi:hypothetical protein
MRHTFLVHVVTDIGDDDPQDLMGDVEDVIAEALDTEALAARMPLGDVDVECVDAFETPGVPA